MRILTFRCRYEKQNKYGLFKCRNKASYEYKGYTYCKTHLRIVMQGQPELIKVEATTEQT